MRNANNERESQIANAETVDDVMGWAALKERLD